MLADKENISKTDRILLKQFKDTGDTQFLGQLYERYIHLVYGVCIKYFGNREESQDAVMDIFEKLLLEVPNYDISNFKNWLYVIAKNHCLSIIRKKKVHFLDGLEELISESFMELEALFHPKYRDSIDDGTVDRLKQCLEKLNESQKECIVFFYYQEKCYQEIAELTKTNVKTVKSNLQNGKRNLKICLTNNNA